VINSVTPYYLRDGRRYELRCGAHIANTNYYPADDHLNHKRGMLSGSRGRIKMSGFPPYFGTSKDRYFEFGTLNVENTSLRMINHPQRE